MEDIAHQYKVENQNWKWSKCWDKAKVVYREINRLNRESYRKRDLFYNMNTPFSFFEGDDDFVGSIPELDEV